MNRHQHRQSDELRTFLDASQKYYDYLLKLGMKGDHEAVRKEYAVVTQWMSDQRCRQGVHVGASGLTPESFGI